MEVTLERLKENGAYAYEAIFLTQLKSYSFGQMYSNDFILYAPTVEYNHCIFHNKLNGLFVEVLKSSSGVVIINGKTYLSNSVVHLNNNDIVNIGLLLKYKVKIKTAIPIDDNSDNDYLKRENDTEDGLPYHNINDSNVENLGNEATLSAVTIQSEISQKVKEKSSEENRSGLLLQETDAVKQIENGKEENEFEKALSIDSSTETESFHSSPETESYHSSSDSKTKKFAIEAASDSFFEHEHLTDYLLRKEHLPDSLSEKEPISDALSEKVYLPDSSIYDKLFPNSSSKEKNLPPTKHSPVSLTEKEFCLKKVHFSSVSVYHSAERSFGCDLCGQSYKSKKDIRFHLMTVHSEEKQIYQIFKNAVKSKNCLNRHLLTHSTEKKFKCSLCQKDFGLKDNLQKHILTHSTEKPFKCSLCEKGFKRKQDLQRHMLSHSTEKQFKCFLCQKDFRRKEHLQRHMLSHSTEKQLKCSLCEKGFKSKQYLQRHMLSHSTEKQFKCSLCEKDFKRKDHLQRHMLTH